MRVPCLTSLRLVKPQPDTPSSLPMLRGLTNLAGGPSGRRATSWAAGMAEEQCVQSQTCCGSMLLGFGHPHVYGT